MKKVLLYIGIGLALLAVPVTVFVVGQNSDSRKKAAPASTLAFSPASTTINVGEKFTLAVKLDTADNQVGLVQLRIVYDPAYLEAEDVTNDAFAPSIKVSKKIDPNGKASITVGAKDTTHPINGSGTIATITMKAIRESATPILVKFTPSPDTMANALGETAEDIIIGRSPASITIHNPNQIATSTLTPTPTVKLGNSTASSPSPTVKLSPTPIASSSASPLSTATQSASLSTSATSSAIVITSIKDNEQINTDTPVIRGKGIPGSTITIIIHSSSEQTAVVTVDANGNWVYQPSAPLEPGDHTVEAMTTDPNTGTTQSDVTAFVVASGNESVSASTGSAIPVSGSYSSTLLTITLGILIIAVGAILPIFL